MNGKIVISLTVVAVILAVSTGITDIVTGQSQQQPVPPSNNMNKLRVIASFFPLYDFARNVGGDRADVSVMVPAGIEPHDWEPTPRDILDAENADMIVYNGAGFESWVSGINARFVVDTSRGIELMESGEEIHEEEQGGQQATNMTTAVTPTSAAIANNNATASSAQEGVGAVSAESNLDPHIWLDPVLAKKQVEAIRDGFVQIYPEDLVDPRLANVIAGEIPNGQVLVLSPIEGLDREEMEQGLGYIDKMRENVENLKVGLECL